MGDDPASGLVAGGAFLTLDGSRWPAQLPLLTALPTTGGLMLTANWADDPEHRGMLGPYFDATSCGGCHLELEPASTKVPPTVMRLLDARDGTRFGAQLNAHTVAPLRPGSGIPDGPVAPRMPPPLFGWGLLEAIPEAALRAVADPEDRNADGISGRLPVSSQGAGRFGWKSEIAGLRHQVAAALANDMGIGTAGFPAKGCPSWAGDCVELSVPALDGLVRAVSRLGVPARRDRQAPDVMHGERLFSHLGCAGCHVPVQRTGDHSDPALAQQIIWPYSDLLLHDMGPELADPDGHREWRTPPLWGVGLMLDRYPGRGLLHDGRARSVEDAVLWHGGEGAAARARMQALEAAEREALVAFVRSL